MNILIIYRFRFVAIGFMLFYEFSKFYLFGDRFLAESFIVYPLIFMTGLVWEKLQDKKIAPYEYIVSSVFTWFVVFMREPFVIAPLFLFSLLLINKSFKKIHALSLAVFIFLTIGTFFIVPFKDFVFDVLIQDYNIIFSKGASNNSIVNGGILKIFFYPIYLFFGGEWSVFRYVLVGLSTLFLLLISYIGIYKKHWKLFAFIFFILSLLNIRILFPFKTFYEAFHIVPWFGVFVFSLFLLLQKTWQYSKRLYIFTVVAACILFGYLTLSPESYIYDNIDPQYEFITNFGKELQNGEVIRVLSAPTDTLFLDGTDDLIYWQANRMSPYKYSWYSAFMFTIPKFTKERLAMFKNTPPDFYYGSCQKEFREDFLLPKEVQNDYVRLVSGGNPTCVFIHKAKLPSITKGQWKRANEFKFELPTKEFSNRIGNRIGDGPQED